MRSTLEFAEREHLAGVVGLQTVPGGVAGSHWTAAICRDAGGTGILKQSPWYSVHYYTCQFNDIPGSYNVELRSRRRGFDYRPGTHLKY